MTTAIVPETRPETAKCAPILISSTDFNGFYFIVFWVGQLQLAHASTLTARLSLNHHDISDRPVSLMIMIIICPKDI